MPSTGASRAPLLTKKVAQIALCRSLLQSSNQAQRQKTANMTHSVADDELRLSGTGTVVVPTKADPSVVDMEEDIDSLNGAEMI